MPLPPALAAKLAKRGLITGSKSPAEERVNEEVIAEDDGDRRKRALLAVSKLSEIQEKPPIMGYPGCPNKYNIHHECTIFCSIYWASGIIEPDTTYLRRKKKILSKYPLPDNWKEEYDPGTGRFFYWDQKTNLVSWLPPLHPHAKPSMAASVLREQNKFQQLIKLPESEPMMTAIEEDDDKEESSEESFSSSSEEEEPVRPPPKRRGHMPKRDILDPMDPSAYSDCPRGTWSSGLAVEDDANTGVDTTASGPIFQQRPYPSPGDVLRANKSKK
ncbi:polyglutamine-binding protein 1 [Neocloeon triangulifer]|uniref:polyglutamine-binding protein 1 n=1 Tax=Neocloeon triangulifer TaxID=2078957 RepID=UPI00286F3F68|nr:polyglutamine-binding protein 1 [Neocloeon triangulifer]XP_059481283.1 polyglutamine-binding protein 1 [Neocloeon triangulifer]